MNREDYKLYTWYPLTDDEYWVDEGVLTEWFPNCQTLVCDGHQTPGIKRCIMTYNNCGIGWSTMAKAGTYMFMIVEKPVENPKIEYTVIKSNWEVEFETNSQQEIDNYIDGHKDTIYQVIFRENENAPFHVYWSK